jgi:hypothetical protein
MTTIRAHHATTHWQWVFAVLAAVAAVTFAIVLTVSAVFGSDGTTRPAISHSGNAPTLCVPHGGAKVC